MDNAKTYNRSVLIILTFTAILMYKGILDVSEDSLAMIFCFFTPVVILVHFIISIIFETRDNEEPITYYVVGSGFLLYALLIVVRGLS